MAETIQTLVTGLSVGGTYALVALGLVLIFGVVNILNIGQLETVMLAPVLFVLLANAGIPVIVAISLSILLTLVASALIHVIGVRPFTARTRRGQRVDYLAPLVATFGLATLIAHGMSRWVGTQPVNFPIETPQSLWYVGEVALVPMQVIDLATVSLILLIMVLVMRRSSFGLSLRVVAEGPTMADCLGINSERVALATAVVAGFLGSVAGLLLSATTNSVSAFMGLDYGLMGLVAMIVGGISSPVGAVLSGLLIGVVQAFATSIISSTLAPLIVYTLLIIILLIKPHGLMGRTVEERL